MDEQEITPHPDYIKGFNEGYILSKYEPDLSNTISLALADNERNAGFKEGMNQWAMEKQQSIQPKWMRKDRLSSLYNTPDKQLDKDKDVEPDIQ